MAATKKIRVDRTYSTDNDTEDKGSASLVEKARQLNTSRTINGVGFNGTANISFGTDSVSEGSSNLYFTNARARGALSGSTGISYNSSTGAISCTITQYTDSNARGAVSFTAGSGAYNSSTGVFTIPTNTNQLTNGAGFYKSGDNVSFGTVSSGALTVSGGITATGEITAYYSDDRLKKDVTPIADPIAKLMAIRGVTFRPNQTALDLGIEDKDEVGVIAQEVRAVLPQLVTGSAFEGYITVKYEKLTALLIEAVKTQQLQIEALQADISRLRGGL